MRNIRKFVNHISINNSNNIIVSKYHYYITNRKLKYLIEAYNKYILLYEVDGDNVLYRRKYFTGNKITINGNRTCIEMIKGCIRIDKYNINYERINSVVITDGKVFRF